VYFKQDEIADVKLKQKEDVMQELVELKRQSISKDTLFDINSFAPKKVEKAAKKTRPKRSDSMIEV
jgi:hypothetical protein